MTILAVDPGPEQSAWLWCHHGAPGLRGTDPNPKVLEMLRRAEVGLLAVEMVQSYGMPVGREVFETVFWAGRFVEACPAEHRLVYRSDVKLHLCRSRAAKDANIRQALLDRYPRTGGGATPQVGTKAQPGPLYGISGHLWAALAIAVYVEDTLREQDPARNLHQPRRET